MLADPLLAEVPLDLSPLVPVGLAEVLAGAARMTRVDRKHLVSRSVADALLARIAATHRVLVIDGRRSTGYRTTYFDTPDLASARAHVQQRRLRWKVRNRLYVEDGTCRTEVKTKDRAGSTVKDVTDTDPSAYAELRGDQARFVGGVLDRYRVGVDVAQLRPVLEVSYRRVTLADTAGHTRVTLDCGVQSVVDGRRMWVDDDVVLVETKGGVHPAAADRALIALGSRPQPFSKYVAAASLLREDLRDNDVRALRGRLLHCASVVTSTDAA